VISPRSEILLPPIVFKDEGHNLTLVIPMENGVIKEDHEADQYIQKSEQDEVVEQQVQRTAPAITNIEIVDINPLPKNPPPPPPPREEVP